MTFGDSAAFRSAGRDSGRIVGNSEAIVACRLCRWDSIQFSRIIGNSSGIHRHW